MNRLFVASVACVIMILSACTMTVNHHGTEATLTEFPDGTRIMEFKNLGTDTRIEITGKSVRQIKKLIPFPQMDGAEMAGPVQFEIRYSYEMDLYDTSGVFVSTFVVETFSDMVDTIPLMIDMGGLPPVPQVDLDLFAADLAVVWVDPQTDWNRFN